MGQSAGKKSKKMAEIPERQLEKYVESEFRAMATVNEGNTTDSLNRQEVLDLLTLLGYDKGKKKLKALHVKTEDSVEIKDYVKTFMADKPLIAKTSRYRDVFQYFDKDSDGTASKEEILNGLESMDVKIDQAMKNTVEKMDADGDGKITYEEYLRMEFKIAMSKGKTGKKAEENEENYVEPNTI